MKVYVVRHGMTDMNKQKLVNAQIDEPLSPE
jgi:broad specificity phosphatase PhoE